MPLGEADAPDVEAVRGVYNWTALDAAYTLAKSNGLPFRFHVLPISSQPRSITEVAHALEVSPASMLAVRGALTEAAYLVRHPAHKIYVIGRRSSQAATRQ